jgi:hypothetical protein
MMTPVKKMQNWLPNTLFNDFSMMIFTVDF